MPFEEDEADEETNNVDIVESAIVKDIDHHFNAGSKVKDCLLAVLQIGLLCSTNDVQQSR